MKPGGGHGWARALRSSPHPKPGTRGPAQRLRRARVFLRQGTGTPRGQKRARGGLDERGGPARDPGPRAPFPPPTPCRGPRSPRAQSRPRRPRLAALPLPGPAARQRAAGRAPRAQRNGPRAVPAEPNGAAAGRVPGAERPHLPGGFLRAAGRLVRHLASPLAQPWRRPSERRSHRARERRARSRWPSRRWPAPSAGSACPVRVTTGNGTDTVRNSLQCYISLRKALEDRKG